MDKEGIGMPGNAEEMDAFFDARAAGYEDHMRENVHAFAEFYAAAIAALPEKSPSPRILDLGIGTGLELDSLFTRFPDARVTGIDLSERMLAVLRAKDRPWQSQLELVRASFLTREFSTSSYDAVVSVMALHHWAPQIKRSLYQRIRGALRKTGIFVNADYVESPQESAERLRAFETMGVDAQHPRHIDLPLCVVDEERLLHEAGFRTVDVSYRGDRTAVFRSSVD